MVEPALGNITSRNHESHQIRFALIYLTGVDWSGDGGLPRSGMPERDLLVIAFATVEIEAFVQVREVLSDLRIRNRFRKETVFKHSDSSDRVRYEFLEAVATTNIEVRVQMITKYRDWPLEFGRLSSNERVASALASAATKLPPKVIAEGSLLLDLNPKRDGKLCTMSVGAVNRATRTGGQQGFMKVKCCPDTDVNFGEIVQVADMVSGAVRRSASLTPTNYPSWHSLVVPW